MKKVMVLLLLCVFLFGFVSAGSLSIMTGRVVEEMGEEFHNLSEEKLTALYEENKENIPEEELMRLYEENSAYINELDFQFNGLNAEIGGLEFDLGFMTCALIKTFLEGEIVETEIPKEIPFKNEVFDIYIDRSFLFSLGIDEGIIERIECSVSADVTYEIYVTSEFIAEVVASGGELEDPVQFYKDSRKSGDIEIKPNGLFKRIKLWIIHFGLRFA